MPRHSTIPIDQCLAQPSSERLPPIADGSKCRDAQPDSVQRARDLGTLSLKWDVPIKPLQKRKESQEPEGKEAVRRYKAFCTQQDGHTCEPRDGQHAQSLHRSVLDGALELREMDTASIPHPEVISS